MTASAALKLPPPEPQDNSGTMSFLEHLEELRKRIISACYGMAAGLVAAYFFVNSITEFLFRPINELLPPGSQFIFTRPGEAFGIIYVQIPLIAAGIAAAPWVMYQVWLFVAPGLYQKEKRYAIPFVLLTSCGFVAGALFNHYVAFRALMVFFAGFSSETLRFMPSLEAVFGLYVRMLIGMGLVFQMPTLAYFLARMGVVTARFLIRQFKYATLAIFVVAAVVTPSSDPWNQTILAGTMLALYVVCIGIAAVFGKRNGEMG